jgi:hypothetical protein
LGYCFPQYKKCIIFDRTWVGWYTYILGDFFANSSGHPAKDGKVPCEMLAHLLGVTSVSVAGVAKNGVVKANKSLLLNRVARWYICKPKIQIWVNF